MEVNRLSKKEKAEIVIQSMLQPVPFGIGSAIATAWSGIDAKLRFNRLERFSKELAKSVERLGKDTFKKADIRSEEFQSLMLNLKEKIEKEHRNEKIKLFKDFLINVLIKGNNISFEKKKYFLEVLNELDNIHISILGMLSKEPIDKGIRGADVMRSIVKWIPGKSERELETEDDYFVSAALEKLDNLKLIMTTHRNGMVLSSININATRNYTLTPLGTELIEFVTEF